jgi:mannose/fructose/N-acetylgalactosamine-specific phosphotransferase system component IIC
MGELAARSAALLALGLVAALDTTAFGQFMVGQPIVTGWLAGWIAGDPLAGIFMGATLQLLWSRLAPVGAAAYPDVGPATVAGIGSLLFAAGRSVPVDGRGDAGFHPLPAGLVFQVPPVAILTGCLLALIVGSVGQRVVTRMRRGNADLGARADRAAASGDFAGVERANLIGLARAAGTGLLLVTGGLAIGAIAQRLLGGLLPPRGLVIAPNPGLFLFWWLGLAAAFSQLAPVTRGDRLALGGGLLGGLLLLGLTR